MQNKQQKAPAKPPIIPAYHIVRQGSGVGFIEDHVSEILLVVEEDVKRAVDERQNVAITEIPTTFDIPGMSNQRAQMYIYFHVLRALKQAQYFPNIMMQGKKAEEQRVFLYTRWFSKEDEEMEKYMDKYIKMHHVDQEIAEQTIMKKDAKPTRRRRRVNKNQPVN